MPQDVWLIWLMLWIDIALILSVALTAYFSFPKLLSEIITTNPEQENYKHHRHNCHDCIVAVMVVITRPIVPTIL